MVITMKNHRTAVGIIILSIAIMLSGCKKTQNKLAGDTKVNSDTDIISSHNKTTDASVTISDFPESGYIKLPKPENLTDWRTHPQDYKLIALTFDDAPAFDTTENNYTRTIIDTVADYEGSATLFVIGSNVVKNGEALLKYAVSRGFELGNHSFSHTALGSLSADECENEIADCNTIIKSITDKEPLFFRPPMLSVGDELLQTTESLGICPVLMSINTYDYEAKTTADQIVDTVVKNAKNGSIVLLHSKYAVTAEAIKPLYDTLYNQNYRFCTLHELFYFTGNDFIPSSTTVSYANIKK